MKKFIFCLFKALLSHTRYAKVAREDNTCKPTTTQTTKSEEQQTSFTWKDKKGNKYTIYTTKKGAFYINRKSAKAGKDYKQYLSKEMKEQVWREFKL